MCGVKQITGENRNWKQVWKLYVKKTTPQKEQVFFFLAKSQKGPQACGQICPCQSQKGLKCLKPNHPWFVQAREPGDARRGGPFYLYLFSPEKAPPFLETILRASVKLQGSASPEMEAGPTIPSPIHPKEPSQLKSPRCHPTPRDLLSFYIGPLPPSSSALYNKIFLSESHPLWSVNSILHIWEPRT